MSVQKNSNPFLDFSVRYIPDIDAAMIDFFEKKIMAADPGFMKDMYSSLSEYCTRKGKRLRPLIILAAYCAYTGVKKPGSDMMNISAVIEIMHSFLLIQDDIIDKALIRRGGKSLHVLMAEEYGFMSHNDNTGSDLSLILADILFAGAIEIISSLKINRRVLKNFLGIFARTYEMTAWGQVLDILHSLPREIELRSAVPRQIGTMKTAYYTVYYPMLMGYILSGGGSKIEMSAIRDFSLPAGLAFQIRDDILGIFGKSEDTGKPSDSDIHEGKLTQLIQSTAESLSGSEREKFMRLFTDKVKRPDAIDYIRRSIKVSGALDRALEKLRDLLDESSRELEKLKIREGHKKIFRGMTDLIREL